MATRMAKAMEAMVGCISILLWVWFCYAWTSGVLERMAHRLGLSL